MPTLQPIAANRGISPQKSETLELATAIPRQLPQPRTVDFAQFLGSVTKAEYWQPTVRTREKHGRIRLSFAMNSVPKITKPMTSVTLGYFDGQTEKWWQSIIIRPKTVFTISPQPFGHHEYPRDSFLESRPDLTIKREKSTRTILLWNLRSEFVALLIYGVQRSFGLELFDHFTHHPLEYQWLFFCDI